MRATSLPPAHVAFMDACAFTRAPARHSPKSFKEVTTHRGDEGGDWIACVSSYAARV
jgi:hypothetical protein